MSIYLAVDSNSNLVDISNISWAKPDNPKCVNFQNLNPGALPTNTLGDVSLEVMSPQTPMEIIQVPAPPNAHPWVPNQVRYLRVSSNQLYTKFAIRFDQPVQWAEVSVGAIIAPVSAGPLAQVWFENSSQERNAVSKSVVISVRTITFTARDPLLDDGSGQPSVKEAGDIATIFVEGFSAAGQAFWQICYWPAPK